MKKILLILILIYQKFLSPVFKNILGVKSSCLYVPTCSEFAKQMILKYGVVKGSGLALLRILSCQSILKFKLQRPSPKSSLSNIRV